jgi:hypothetical protein
MNPVIRVIASRYARKVCIDRLVRKIRKYGKVMVSITVVDNPEWTERAAVDAALREEQKKRGLR